MASQFATYPSLKDKAVIVTGGASGIGEAIVRGFAQQYARVFFLDVQEGAAQQLQRSLVAQGLAPPAYLQCDLRDIEALRGAVDGIVATCGTVDVLVNNAGNDARHRLEEVTPEFWDAAMAVNLKHQFFMAQAVAPAMQAAKSGSIINMSSISWMIPSIGLPVYVTAKAAIVGMTRTLAHELGADNIRVNCVLPGASSLR